MGLKWRSFIFSNKNSMKKCNLLIIAVLSAIVFSSCTQKIYTKYNLFQKGLDSIKNYDYKAPLIQNNDGIVIQIYSATLSQDQVAVFNMGTSSGVSSTSSSLTNLGIAGGASSSSTSGGVTYTVDLEGNIIMPIIGSIKAVGTTAAELSNLIKAKLEVYIKDPIVKVSFVGIKVNVLGEVKVPGTKIFTNTNPTILDALGQSGDFTEGAKREEIYLIRDINGKRTSFKINMNDASVFNSEVYQLMQNDLIYVPANDIKLKMVNQDPDTQKKIQVAQVAVMGLSALSVLFNAFLLFKKL